VQQKGKTVFPPLLPLIPRLLVLPTSLNPPHTVTSQLYTSTTCVLVLQHVLSACSRMRQQRRGGRRGRRLATPSRNAPLLEGPLPVGTTSASAAAAGGGAAVGADDGGDDDSDDGDYIEDDYGAPNGLYHAMIDEDSASLPRTLLPLLEASAVAGGNRGQQQRDTWRPSHSLFLHFLYWNMLPLFSTPYPPSFPPTQPPQVIRVFLRQLASSHSLQLLWSQLSPQPLFPLPQCVIVLAICFPRNPPGASSFVAISRCLFLYPLLLSPLLLLCTLTLFLYSPLTLFLYPLLLSPLSPLPLVPSSPYHTTHHLSYHCAQCPKVTFESTQVTFESTQVTFESTQVTFESTQVTFESTQVTFESTQN
ncbi:unnamed protein product, partial [Closterium sp. NIES-65]